MLSRKKFAQSVDHIIVGLGNPGSQYEQTRHNAGFIVLDTLAQRLDVKVDRLKFKSLCGFADYKDKKLLLIKPQTFMNLSGEAVVEAMNFYKLGAQDLTVICDDVNFEVGRMRIRRKGSDGGQNGLKNIIYLTGHDDFSRIKIGVGKKPHPDYDLAKWVLSRFTQDEIKTVCDTAEKAADAALMIALGETDKAMSRYNS